MGPESEPNYKASARSVGKHWGSRREPAVCLNRCKSRALNSKFWPWSAIPPMYRGGAEALRPYVEVVFKHMGFYNGPGGKRESSMSLIGL